MQPTEAGEVMIWVAALIVVQFSALWLAVRCAAASGVMRRQRRIATYVARFCPALLLLAALLFLVGAVFKNG
jgi:hypothetical protein